MKNLFTLFALTLVLATASMLRAQTFIDENFNSGIPNSWSVTVPSCGNSQGDSIKWIGTTNGWRGQGMAYSLDSTEFVVIDSELPAVYCQANEYLYTPVFDASAVSSLTLEFDHYFRHYWPSTSGTVEVYYNSSWIPLTVFIGMDYGNWLNPDNQVIDLTPYISANVQVRFHYQANWDWFWAVDNVKIYAPSAFPVTVTSTDPLCNGDCNGTATATPNGGVSPYTYQWDDTNNQTTQTATGLCDGTYNVTVVDNNGDSVVSSVTITEPPAITVIDSTLDVLCNGDSAGSVFAVVLGGTSPYSYSWSNGATTAYVANLPAGSYTVTITDGNGCTKVDSMSITQPAALTLSVSSTDDNGNCDGTATVNVSGGVSPYFYLWDANTGNQTTQTADSLCTGTYCITITDGNGCTKDTCVIVDLYTGIDAGSDARGINDGLHIYPNPANNWAVVEFSSSDAGVAELLVLDITGRVVSSGHVMASQGLNQIPLDLSALSMGIFTLQLRYSAGILTAKMVLQ